MNPYLSASGIRLNDCLFTEPVDLAGWRPPQYAGILAVFVHDSSWAPRPLKPLCFGEFGNNVSRGALLANYGQLLAAANGKSLLVAVCPMPYSTTTQRWAVRDELVWAYNPSYQAEGQQRHEAMQASAEPREEPRRRIGFMPECEPVA
jgi:hypothetical protein